MGRGAVDITMGSPVAAPCWAEADPSRARHRIADPAILSLIGTLDGTLTPEGRPETARDRRGTFLTCDPSCTRLLPLGHGKLNGFVEGVRNARGSRQALAGDPMDRRQEAAQPGDPNLGEGAGAQPAEAGRPESHSLHSAGAQLPYHLHGAQALRGAHRAPERRGHAGVHGTRLADRHGHGDRGRNSGRRGQTAGIRTGRGRQEPAERARRGVAPSFYRSRAGAGMRRARRRLPHHRGPCRGRRPGEAHHRSLHRASRRFHGVLAFQEPEKHQD